MTNYEADPRVTQVGDDYRIDIKDRTWRIYRDGDRWFSQAPPNDSPHLPDDMTFEHPSKQEAFAALLNPRGGRVIAPSDWAVT